MKKTTHKNVIYSMSSQLVIMFFAFLNRQYFAVYLGKELLGINGVISNVLTILQLAEFGMGTALTYFFYEPLVKHDYKRISQLLLYAKSIYKKIAISVSVLGVCLIPFLGFIIKTSVGNRYVTVYYILFLINIISSYFVVYKSLLLMADQKIYIINLVRTAVLIVQNTAQIIILKHTQNYYLYLVVLIAGTVINNIIITGIADKQYGLLLGGEKAELGKSEVQEIWTMLKSTAVYKVGVVIVNNTDNILISILVNTITVGLYSNYVLITSALNAVYSTFITSITAKLGEINANPNKSYSYKVFREMLLLFHHITVLCSLCYLFCANDFIELFFGKDYTLHFFEVVAVVICFYIQHAIDPVWIYRETMGLFNEIKYLMLYTSVFNLIISIVLGKIIGLAGIIIATGIARLLTTVWYEPRVLYGKFSKRVTSYYFVQLRYFAESIVACIIVYFCVKRIPVSYPALILKAIIICFISTVVILGMNIKTEEIKPLRAIFARRILNSLKKKS